MQIVQLTAYHVHIPLKKPIKHASHMRNSTENLIVRCVLDDGTEGFGEGVPREYVTGETIDSAIALLKRSDLASRLESCQDFAQAIEMCDRLQLADVPGDERGCQGNATRCAVELALLDAYGKKFGKPVYEATKQMAPELFAFRDEVQYSGAITSSQGFKLRLAAWKMRVYGFRQLKIKVGIDGQDDVQRMQIIRRRVGSKVDLRIDANEAWNRDNAVEKIRSLEPFGITSVEQPIAHAEVDALKEVRQEVQTPIMLDESLCSQYDAEMARDNETCDLFNLRLSKCGGYLPTLRLAQFAKKHGLGYQLGCQVGETALLSAAGRHFACSVADIRYREGSFDRHLVKEALGTEDITFGYGGRAPALKAPGLGVTVDLADLKRVTTRRETIIG